MARIILGSYMIRYPLGGMMSWVLQYLRGLQALDHQVYFVEKSGYRNACYNPMDGTMTDDCTYGMNVVDNLLARFDMGDSWCFVDRAGTYYGMSKQEIEDIFRSADVFLDMGTHGSWLEEAQQTDLRVLIDGEPGFTQLKMAEDWQSGEEMSAYEYYFTTGQNVGTSQSSVPTAGKAWKHTLHPVDTELVTPVALPESGAFTTVMNWQSYEERTHDGVTYGHKDREFEKFATLPRQVSTPLEIAVSGNVPEERLSHLGWRVRNAQEISISLDRFYRYIANSRGEFSVCKHGYVTTQCGWFSDRSAAYLATGRPVILEDTGFSAHLPCGEGLFAVRTIEEAADAITEIERRPTYHARRAREIAKEYFDAPKVMSRFLNQLDI